jgi:hypothetical protein
MPIKLKPAVLNILRLIPDKDKAKHQDYAHVVAYNEEFARPMWTGKKIGPLIRRFNKTESVEDHLQRIELTTSVTPPVLNSIMGPVRKIARVKPNVNRADFGLDRKDDTEKLAKVESTFYAGKDVRHWLGSVGFDYGAIDPNAFCLINFDKFDGRYETPKPYPTLITCKDAWNFEYFNGILQWLLVHRDYKYMVLPDVKPKKGAKMPEPEWRDGNWFCAYLENHHVEFRQVDPKTIKSELELQIVTFNGDVVPGFDEAIDSTAKPIIDQGGLYYFRVSNTELYEVIFYEHKSGKVQAFRMGYKLDAETDGRTCVAMWHPAMAYLLKTIKSGSELDISAALHVFLKEIGYEPKCPGYTEEVKGTRVQTACDGGTDPNGVTCRRCNGSGLFRIGSGQQMISLALPRRKEDLFDLPALHHYFDLPIDIVKWLDEYVDKLRKLAYEAVYNTEPMDRAQVQPTATAELRDNENVYDTLQPGCAWFAESLMLIRELIAVYTVTKMDGFVNQYEFPRNLRFESIGDLVALKKAMKDAGASDALMIQVDRDVADLVFIDDEQALKRAKTMVSFDPFGGKDQDTIVSLISQDLATKEDKVFWFAMSKIFSQAEAECAERTPPVDFYDLTRPKQQELIDKLVKKIVDALAADAEVNAGARIGVEDMSVVTGTNPSGADVPAGTSDVKPDNPQDANA